MKSLHDLVLLAALTTLPAVAQQRVYLGGTPTNLNADWGMIVAAPDELQFDFFVAFLPLSALPAWAAWDSDTTMDLSFGPGNWLRCRMEALAWSYLSPNACAHQPAAGGNTPRSLLTTSYDFGAYTGVPGLPFFPEATLFFGASESYIAGFAPGLGVERWQLRSRGFSTNDDWNACPGGWPGGPNFTGWVAVRFRYQFF